MTIILIVAGLLVAGIGAAFLYSAPAGIMIAFLGKPVIDATWNYSFGGINALKIVGVLVPIMFFAYAVANRSPARRTPLLSIWLIYSVYTCLSYGFKLAYAEDPVNEFIKVVEYSFRTLNGLAAYLMVQAYFRDTERLRQLLLILLLASLFPMLTGVYQAATGVVWRERSTVGLTRNVGLYHDAFTFRGYAFQTLTAIILYWAYFVRKSQVFRQLLLVGLSLMALVVLYKVYSKAGVLIILLWIIIWTAGRRSFMPAMVVVFGLFVVNAVTSELLFSEVQQLYTKEVIASGDYATTREKQRTLGGRWFIWSQYLDDYWRSSITEQMFGTGRVVPAHNDFLGKLISSGVFGVTLYALLLWAVGVRLVRNYFRDRSPLNVMGLMIFTMWMVDTVGLSPSVYTSYQWYVWGIIGLAIGGIDQPDTPKARKKVASFRPI